MPIDVVKAAQFCQFWDLSLSEPTALHLGPADAVVTWVSSVRKFTP